MHQTSRKPHFPLAKIPTPLESALRCTWSLERNKPVQMNVMRTQYHEPTFGLTFSRQTGDRCWSKIASKLYALTHKSSMVTISKFSKYILSFYHPMEKL